jgi:regulator of cell morphogenesis and NO signaling
MQAIATPDVPQETGALIDHILSRYHHMHRADLASLVPLAKRVEQLHAADPAFPQGLARALAMMAREMEDHMSKEEHILFPAMRAGRSTEISHPLAVMRADHDDHAGNIALIRHLTRDLATPAHASGSWRSLFGGMAAMLDDLAAHIALENEVLFPRFEAAA